MSNSDDPRSALVGGTGFVGSSLLRQSGFAAAFSSRDIGELSRVPRSLVVCAGAPAQKWIANADPAGDRARLASLFDALERLECERLVLVSTVDVFADPRGVDEDSVPATTVLGAYGLHRLELEQFVRRRFPGALIVRLPGLVGPGLRKNAVFDLHHGNAVDALDARSRYQFYPVVQLWRDIETALAAGLPLVHLTAEPVSLSEVGAGAFGIAFRRELDRAPADYDFRTRHAAVFGGSGPYTYSKRESLLAIRAYAQSEPRRSPRAA
jgi:hypothetical protein